MVRPLHRSTSARNGSTQDPALLGAFVSDLKKESSGGLHSPEGCAYLSAHSGASRCSGLLALDQGHPIALPFRSRGTLESARPYRLHRSHSSARDRTSICSASDLGAPGTCYWRFSRLPHFARPFATILYNWTSRWTHPDRGKGHGYREDVVKSRTSSSIVAGR